VDTHYHFPRVAQILALFRTEGRCEEILDDKIFEKKITKIEKILKDSRVEYFLEDIDFLKAYMRRVLEGRVLYGPRDPDEIMRHVRGVKNTVRSVWSYHFGELETACEFLFKIGGDRSRNGSDGNRNGSDGNRNESDRDRSGSDGSRSLDSDSDRSRNLDSDENSDKNSDSNKNIDSDKQDSDKNDPDKNSDSEKNARGTTLVYLHLEEIVQMTKSAFGELEEELEEERREKARTKLLSEKGRLGSRRKSKPLADTASHQAVTALPGPVATFLDHINTIATTIMQKLQDLVLSSTRKKENREHMKILEDVTARYLNKNCRNFLTRAPLVCKEWKAITDEINKPMKKYQKLAKLAKRLRRVRKAVAALDRVEVDGVAI